MHYKNEFILPLFVLSSSNKSACTEYINKDSKQNYMNEHKYFKLKLYFAVRHLQKDAKFANIILVDIIIFICVSVRIHILITAFVIVAIVDYSNSLQFSQNNLSLEFHFVMFDTNDNASKIFGLRAYQVYWTTAE